MTGERWRILEVILPTEMFVCHAPARFCSRTDRPSSHRHLQLRIQTHKGPFETFVFCRLLRVSSASAAVDVCNQYFTSSAAASSMWRTSLFSKNTSAFCVLLRETRELLMLCKIFKGDTNHTPNFWGLYPYSITVN